VKAIVDVSDCADRLVDEALEYLKQRSADRDGAATAESALRRVMMREAEARGAFLPTIDTLRLLAKANGWSADFREWPLSSSHSESVQNLNNLKQYLASQLA